MKKYQYIFYKHWLLHGLNISAALHPGIFDRSTFRLYWVLLNASYVMEFFLQTLVRKSFLKQEHMLRLQHVLMVASTLAALPLIQHVNAFVALSSMVLNFAMRKHDFLNVSLITVTAALFGFGE